ncbi:adenylate/guanylate cyclase domain-containing protein [Blastococcus sp. SYSU D00695]
MTPPPASRLGAQRARAARAAAGAARRADEVLSWAPRGRFAVPVIVVLVNLANLVGVATVALLLALGEAATPGRTRVLVAALVYVVVAFPIGTWAGLRHQRGTTSWVFAGRDPTADEAAQALQLPDRAAEVTAGVWVLGAALLGTVAAVSHPDARVGIRVAVAVLLGGLVAFAFTYMLVARAARTVTARALVARPPTAPLVMSVRRRLLYNWSLTSGVPMLAVLLLFLDPTRPEGPGATTVASLVTLALAVGLLATLIQARSVGAPLRELREAVQRVGAGDHTVRVTVDDAGEIGLLQEGVNSMATGLAERERMRDLFGRHVGATVAQRALADGVSLGGEVRTVAALFVDIAGSTALVRRTGPEEVVGLLNRFFAVVVDTIEAEGGLVNKFEGDGALCVFGAPTEHPDPAGSALRAARRICAVVARAGEVDVGIGVACGPVWAGQVGAASRLEYTVIGDPVNEAARLTDLAKDHPGRALASQAVVDAAGGDERDHWAPDAEVVLRGRGERTVTWARAS